MTLPTDKSCIITLDGPAGAGKSSISRALAKRLGLDYLDTGAMYRAVAHTVYHHGVDPQDESAIQKVLDTIEIRFDWTADPPLLLVNQKDITSEIRTPDVSAMASKVAALSPVRRLLVQQQRAIGQEHPRLVTEGRDQGSVVFKDAQAKIYLDASPLVRAQRRADQLKASGTIIDVNELAAQIEERDHRDANREDSPLICPQGALNLDTSNLTFDQVLQRIVEHVCEVLDISPATLRGN